MSEQPLLPEVGEAGSNVGADEEQDWLPEETKQRVARRADYQTKQLPCEACQ